MFDMCLKYILLKICSRLLEPQKVAQTLPNTIGNGLLFSEETPFDSCKRPLSLCILGGRLREVPTVLTYDLFPSPSFWLNDFSSYAGYVVMKPLMVKFNTGEVIQLQFCEQKHFLLPFISVQRPLTIYAVDKLFSVVIDQFSFLNHE